MSFNKTVVCVALALASFSSASMASDGKVNFSGEIVDTPCVVSTDSQSVDVSLGQVKSSHFAAIGDTSDFSDFKINLEECSTATLKNATVQFNGAASSNKDLLAINSGANAASGVGIEIADSTGTIIPLNTVSGSYALADDENTLNFKAHYKATVAAVTVGAANAQADFTVAYK